MVDKILCFMLGHEWEYYEIHDEQMRRCTSCFRHERLVYSYRYIKEIRGQFRKNR